MNNITRLFDFPYYQLEKYNLKDALVTKYDGQWIKTSTQEYLDKANAISRGLLRLGVNKNDKIAIISSNNRTEWHITDIGVLQTGAQTVPMYPTISAEDYQYILNHSESQYVFVSDDEVYEKLQSIKANVPSLTLLDGIYPLFNNPVAVTTYSIQVKSNVESLVQKQVTFSQFTDPMLA